MGWPLAHREGPPRTNTNARSNSRSHDRQECPGGGSLHLLPTDAAVDSAQTYVSHRVRYVRAVECMAALRAGGPRSAVREHLLGEAGRHSGSPLALGSEEAAVARDKGVALAQGPAPGRRLRGHFGLTKAKGAGGGDGGECRRDSRRCELGKVRREERLELGVRARREMAER